MHTSCGILEMNEQYGVQYILELDQVPLLPLLSGINLVLLQYL